jgi:hypothetical protein
MRCIFRVPIDPEQAPTIFPIVFATVASQALAHIAQYQAERGTQLRVLEQLLRSKSVASTVVMHLSLRIFGILGSLLTILWALSPLGSQASLRIIAVTNAVPSSTVDLRYLSMYYGPDISRPDVWMTVTLFNSVPLTESRELVGLSKVVLTRRIAFISQLC